MKNLIFLFILIFFTSCSSTTSRSLLSDFSFNNSEITYTSSWCTNTSYIINKNDKEYGRIFIESISLNSNCFWNGLPRSYFEGLLTRSLNVKSLRVLERLDYPNYEFTTYLVNDRYFLNLIYNFTSLNDTFILDYKGKYFEKKVREFDKHYGNIYINKKRFNMNYEDSLVQKNIINNYFQKEMIEE